MSQNNLLNRNFGRMAYRLRKREQLQLTHTKITTKSFIHATETISLGTLNYTHVKQNDIANVCFKSEKRVSKIRNASICICSTNLKEFQVRHTLGVILYGHNKICI